MQIGDLVLQLKELFPRLKEYSMTNIIKFALQKQIPKEAKWDIDGWVCPNCRCKRKERFSYCVACGQALKRTKADIEPSKDND